MGIYYIKRPIKVKAAQWHKPGDNPDVRAPTRVEMDTLGLGMRLFGGEGPFGMIDTLEGPHVVSPGDWIIREIAGEVYSCKDRIFRETHDPVDEAPGAQE